MIYIQEDYLG